VRADFFAGMAGDHGRFDGLCGAARRPSRTIPSTPNQARRLLQKAIADYEKVLPIQAPDRERLSVHPRGDLLAGLAEGWS